MSYKTVLRISEALDKTAGGLLSPNRNALIQPKVGGISRPARTSPAQRAANVQKINEFKSSQTPAQKPIAFSK